VSLSSVGDHFGFRVAFDFAGIPGTLYQPGLPQIRRHIVGNSDGFSGSIIVGNSIS
jgi:hypothetical protein